MITSHIKLSIKQFTPLNNMPTRKYKCSDIHCIKINKSLFQFNEILSYAAIEHV